MSCVKIRVQCNHCWGEGEVETSGFGCSGTAKCGNCKGKGFLLWDAEREVPDEHDLLKSDVW